MSLPTLAVDRMSVHGENAMRLALLFNCVACVLFCVALLVNEGGEILKVASLLTAAISGVLVAQLKGWKAPWKAAASGAGAAAFAFLVVGIAGVFSASWSSGWCERISAAVYLGLMSAMFFGVLGGALGLVSGTGLWLRRRTSARK
jgi:hypothetical protein